MNKSITGAVLGLAAFLLGYCVFYWFLIMPKFYPIQEMIAFKDPVKNAIAIKFLGSFVVAVPIGLVGFIIGRRLPARAGLAVHLAAWAMMIAATIYLVGREMNSYIWKLL